LTKQKILERLTRSGRNIITDNNKKQAMIPEGAIVLENFCGTAPGIIIEEDNRRIILMPGPPREMKDMFEKSVRPYLQKLSTNKFVSKYVRFYGIGESLLETKIKHILDNQTNPTLALYAKTGEVLLRITASASTFEEAEELITQQLKEIEKLVGEYIYLIGDEDISSSQTELHSVVANLLIENNLTLSIAESLTGGLLTSMLVEKSGISNSLLEGIVCYSNDSKITALGVKEQTLERFGAVSEQTARENLDEPIFINYPVEAVVPIFKPGSPSEHVGYLALHDEDGNPLSKAKPVNYYRELANGYNNRVTANSMASTLISQGKAMFEGFANGLDEARQLEMLSRIHSNAIIKDILDRLKNGLYGKNLDIGDSSEVSRIMFYRALKGQRTRVLFIPKEVMSYMAFDFDNRGFGISLLDNMKVLISLRIQFMLAQLRAGIMNSIPETLVTLRIDEKDPDPRKTIQIANVMALQSRSNSGLIIGASNVQTIEDRVNQANIRMAIESDNPKIPQIGHDVSKTTADIPAPDNEVADSIKRDTIMGTGLTPDMVDNSLSSEFAANVLQGNFITNLIAFQKQERFNPLLTDFVRKVITVSPYLFKRLREIIRDNLNDIIENIKEASGDKTLSIQGLSHSAIEVLIDGIIDKFTSAFEVTLPAPPNDNTESKAEQLQQYEERVDKAIEFVISQDTLPESIVSEDGANMVEAYAAIVKADLIRDWMLENNYMPEIMNYITVSDDGVQTYEKNKAIRDLTVKTVKAMTEFFKEGKNIADSTEAVIKANDMVVEDDYSSSSSSSDDNDSSGGDMGDMGGEDPFSEESSEESGNEQGSGEEGNANMSGNEAQDGPAD